MFIIVSTLVKQYVLPVEQACCGALNSSRFLVGVLTLVSVLYEPLFVICPFHFGHCIVCSSIYSGSGPGGSMSQVVGSNSSYKLITNTAWVRAQLCKLQKRCTRLAAASDKTCKLLAQGRWSFPGTPASSTTKTGRPDIAEILLKVALNTKNQSNPFTAFDYLFGIFILFLQSSWMK